MAFASWSACARKGLNLLRKIDGSRILCEVSELAAGTMVTPNVRLVRPLGEGGMGAVWVADHLALRTEVVVKFISDSLKANVEARERFSREAAAAAQVKSPHVVQTFDHGVTEDGRPYIVMELLEGRDLARHLDVQGRITPEATLDIVVQLARALDRAHERGIIHRDIKPGNIFLCDNDGRDLFVKLLDFGIAKGVDAPKIDSNTKTGSMIGSPFYMSPEQILGSKDVDRRSDLWSLGVVTFEAMTGHKPFDAETMGGLAIKIHSEPLPVPSKLASWLPPSVDEWFLRACSRKIEDRFSTAREFAEALSLAIGGTMPPRSSLEPAVASAKAPTLLATGAATDAGLAAPPMHSSARGLMMLVAIVAVLGPASYFAIRFATKPPADPKGLVAQPSAPAPDKSLGIVPPTPADSAKTVTAEPPTPTPSTAASIVHTGHVGGPRVRPVVSVAPPPASTPPKLPPPPPATSGHDIF